MSNSMLTRLLVSLAQRTRQVRRRIGSSAMALLALLACANAAAQDVPSGGPPAPRYFIQSTTLLKYGPADGFAAPEGAKTYIEQEALAIKWQGLTSGSAMHCPASVPAFSSSDFLERAPADIGSRTTPLKVERRLLDLPVQNTQTVTLALRLIAVEIERGIS